MASNSKDLWKGLAPTLCWRRSALNILQNHFEEAVSLNKRIEPFLHKNGKGEELLPVEEFLFALAGAKLPFSRRAVEHFHKIAQQWPVGTVCWEDLPVEKNPYSAENSRFRDFKTKPIEKLLAKELLRDNRDLLLQTVAQGRKAAQLGLAESDCELQDEVLKEAWLFGFRKELEKLQGEKNGKD